MGSPHIDAPSVGRQLSPPGRELEKCPVRIRPPLNRKVQQLAGGRKRMSTGKNTGGESVLRLEMQADDESDGKECIAGNDGRDANCEQDPQAFVHCASQQNGPRGGTRRPLLERSKPPGGGPEARW